MSKKTINFKNDFLNDANEYIPICCHYDKRTLLTKNGELVQTIRIHGLNQEHISRKLLGLRKILRQTLKKHLNTDKIACWVHTVRKRRNLDDPLKYSNILNQKIHDQWTKKNFWHDKFSNTLYVSFVYSGQDMKIKDFQSFIDSFNANKTLESHNKYLDESYKYLDATVKNISDDLSEFGCERIGIYYKGNDAYCEILSLFYGLVRGIEIPIKISEKDISEIIGSFSYAVGTNKIEVISNEKRKYATILSVKEYHEVKAVAVDQLLQQPTEFVITEVFYFDNPKNVKKKIERQQYIAKVSKDNILNELNGINDMMDCENNHQLAFCNQQISVLIMNEDINHIETSTQNASFYLSKVGLSHVREDINIENSFWSQLPGNFKFLRRLSPVSINNIASMSSLHNFPAGSHINPWGRAITIFRTEKGTPFFFNFHISENSSAKCLLIGNDKSGKTVLANFIMSEAMKFDPALLFVTYCSDSEVFIKGCGGNWSSTPICINPFRVPSIINNDIFLRGFLLAMAGHNFKELSNQEIKVIDDIILFIKSLPDEQKTYSQLSEFNFEGEAASSVKEKLKDYLIDGIYYKYFIDSNEYSNTKDKILGINFEYFSNQSFKKQNYPSTERELPKYYDHFNKFSIFRELLLYTNILKFLDEYKDYKQILKLENFNNLCTNTFSKEFYSNYFSRLSDEDIIYVNSISYESDSAFFKSDLWEYMQNIFESKIYLPAESVNYQWKEDLLLSDEEYNKLKIIIPSSRLFVISQQDNVVLCELSIASLQAVIKVLSSDKKLIDQCNTLIENKGKEPEKWLEELYDSIS